MTTLPIIHIDKLAKELGVERIWLTRNWLNSDNPPPHFRDGRNVFFELESLRAWAAQRSVQSLQGGKP